MPERALQRETGRNHASKAGDAIYGGNYRCSLGFNYDNTSLSHPGGFAVADAFVGESVTRDGSTTGVHSGTVTALDVTVRYRGHPGGTVRGLIQTNVCAEPGDSGSPLYDGNRDRCRPVGGRTGRRARSRSA